MLKEDILILIGTPRTVKAVWFNQSRLMLASSYCNHISKNQSVNIITTDSYH